ncbi:EamA family transporter [Angustibacter aerolatus]
MGVAAALGAAGLFSVNATVSKVVLGDGLTPIQLVSARSAGAAVLLLAFTALTRPAALRIGLRELGFLAVYGVTGIAMVQWLYLVAIARMPVGVALLLEYTAPLMVALYVRAFRGEQVRRRMWWALALALTGLAVVAQVWSGLTLDGIGVLAGFGAAAALGAYYLLGERGMGSRDPVSLMAFIFTFSALLWAVVEPWWRFPFGLLADHVQVLPGVATTAPVWLLVIWVCVLGTVAPFGLVLVAVRHIGPTRTGIVCMVEPVTSGLVAWVVLGEVLTGVQLLGAAVVLVAVGLAETARRRHDDAVPLPEGVAPS